MAEGKTSVTHLADEVGPSRQELDDLLFAKAKLTKADLNVWRRTQLFDSHCYARFHAVQGAGLALSCHSIGPRNGHGIFHIAVPPLLYRPTTVA